LSANFAGNKTCPFESKFCWCFRTRLWCAALYSLSPKLDLCSFYAGTEAYFGLFLVEVYFCIVWYRLNYRHFCFV
jgi:hypothetical protein